MKNIMTRTFLLGLMLTLAACSKLNLENYEALKMGMDKTQVESIIGGASECTETLGSESCIWGSETGKHIKINFVADKAVLFSHDGLN